MEKVSYTTLQDFRSCRQLWQWRKEYAPIKTPTALWFGTLVHEAIAEYYREGDWERAFERECMQVPESEESKEGMELALKVLNHYFKWANYKDTIDQLKVDKVEVPFAFPLKSGYTMNGRIDGVIHYGKKKNEVWVHEIKTASQMEDDWLLLSEQATIYEWALSQLMPKAKVMGTLYTIIRKKAPTEPEVRGDSLWLAKNALTDSITILDAMSKTGLDFESERLKAMIIAEENDNPFVWRRHIRHNDYERRDIRDRVDLIIRDMEDAAIYPNPTKSCAWCGFQQPCIALQRGDDYGALLETMYKKR